MYLDLFLDRNLDVPLAGPSRVEAPANQRYVELLSGNAIVGTLDLPGYDVRILEEQL